MNIKNIATAVALGVMTIAALSACQSTPKTDSTTSSGANSCNTHSCNQKSSCRKGTTCSHK